MLRTLRRMKAGCILILGVLPAFGQAAAAPPAFEVASIKPSDPAETIAIKRSGYRIATTSTSLQMLITWAYDVHSDRLYGKPKWLDGVRYDIAANVSRLQEMMQTLLAERFKLAVHHETRELPMFAMVLANSGPKVHLTEASGSMGQNPFNMPGRGQLIGNKVSTAMLAKALSDQLGRSVHDETGLKGVFDFTLEWEPDTVSTGADDALTPSVDVRTGASLFTAMQEQLGLKLEARKGAVDVIVIDHIDSVPTAN